MRLRLPHKSRLPLLSGALFFVSAIVFSFWPRIEWRHNERNFLPSLYDGLSAVDRWKAMFRHWDVDHYVYLATHGYPHGLVDHVAFFPLWPAFLHLLDVIVPLDSSWLPLLALPLNLVLFTAACFVWREVIAATPLFGDAPEWPRAEGRFLFLLALYPTVLFNFVAYPESLLLLLLGLSLRAAQESMPLRLALLLPLVLFTKHIGVVIGAGLAVWYGIFRARGRFLPFLGYALGLALLLSFYCYATGDPFSWAKVQAAWGRHLAPPWAVLLDLRGRGVDMALYAVALFALPLWLGARFLRSKKAPEDWLALFFTGALLGPVWIGGSAESLYRVLSLSPYLLALPALRLRGAGWKTVTALFLLLNLHATYRFVAGLHLT